MSAGIAIAAGLVAIAAGFLQLPRPPVLDGERWFKLVFATLLRGRADAAAADRDAWAADVDRFALYHPAGRQPERKVLHPVVATLPGAAVPGERALVEKLAELTGHPARWRWLYVEDPTGRDARLGDPAALGPDYEPAAVLGHGRGWDALAAWSEAVPAALKARLPATWILARGTGRGPDLLGALAAELGVAALAWPEGGSAAATAAVVAAADRAAPNAGDRVVLVGEGEGFHAILRALAENAALRDATAAVVAIGGVIGGLPETDAADPLSEAACRDWLAANFKHRVLDTELSRLTPYFSVAWLDPSAEDSPAPGAFGLPLYAQRFPEPVEEPNTLLAVEPVDLGPLPVDPALPLPLVARALWFVVVGWVQSRR